MPAADLVVADRPPSESRPRRQTRPLRRTVWDVSRAKL